MLASAHGSVAQLQAALADAQADAAAAGAAAQRAEQELRDWQAEAALCQRQIRHAYKLTALQTSSLCICDQLAQDDGPAWERGSAGI